MKNKQNQKSGKLPLGNFLIVAIICEVFLFRALSCSEQPGILKIVICIITVVFIAFAIGIVYLIKKNSNSRDV